MGKRNIKPTFCHIGHYICKCGKEFTKAQSYNAHLSHCKLNLSEEAYNDRVLLQKENFKLGNEKLKLIRKEKKELEYNKNKQEWESTVHYCEKCGKELPHRYEEIFGSGRFCSRACANSRTRDDAVKRKIALSSIIKGKNAKSLNGHYKGYYCASSYELIFLVYCLDHNINIERNKFTFSYIWENSEHIYIPDFYLPDIDLIVECKGFCPHIDNNQILAKANSVNNHNYKIFYEEDLKDYWEYCKEYYKVKTYRDLCELLYEEKDLYKQKCKKDHWNVGDKNPAYGRHWYTNGTNNKYDYVCPVGYWPGRTI